MMLTVVTATRSESVRMLRRIRREYRLFLELTRPPPRIPFGWGPAISVTAEERRSVLAAKRTARTDSASAPASTVSVGTGRKMLGTVPKVRGMPSANSSSFCMAKYEKRIPRSTPITVAPTPKNRYLKETSLL